MDMNEFNAKTVITQDAQNVYFDVRGHGDRQGEAVDSYLHAAADSIRMGVSTFGSRKVVLITDASAIIPDTASKWLDELQQHGVYVDVKLDRP
jgi:hypothetical protein